MADAGGAGPSAEAPRWLDAAFAARALGAAVRSVEVGPATAPGDNYASLMLRARAVLEDEGADGRRECSLIVKCLPSGEMFQKAIKESGAFQVEGTMFSWAVPRMEELLEAAAPGRFPPFSARCLLHEDTVIVLQDLKLATWPGFEHYSAKLRGLERAGYDKLLELNEYNEDAFNVVLHGDFWVNNMLFRYDEASGQPAEVRFCDLQLCHAAPPALDLIYFLYSSVSEDVSTRHVDLLVREYHAELSTTLQLLGQPDGLSLGELRAQMQACGQYATLAAFLAAPVVMSPPSTPFDTEAALDADNDAAGAANVHLFRGDTYCRWARRVLPDMLQRGWLDV